MTSDFSATLYQAHANDLPSRSAIAGSCWGKNVAAAAALCMAFFASPAMAQEPSTYQGYLDQCLNNAKESLQRAIVKATAEGNTARVDMLTQRLESHPAQSIQKCETYSRGMLEHNAKIAKIREDEGKQEKEKESNNQKVREGNAKIRENTAKINELHAQILEIEKRVDGKGAQDYENMDITNSHRNLSKMYAQISAMYLQRVEIYEQIGGISEKHKIDVKDLIEKARSSAANSATNAENNAIIAKNRGIIAKTREETAEIRKINEVFQKVNAELPQLIRDMEAVLAGKITGGQRDAVIRKLEAYVVTGHDLIKRARAIPGFLTPENIEVIAGFEKSVLRVESSLRGTTRK